MSGYSCAKRAADPSNESAACERWCGDYKACPGEGFKPIELYEQSEGARDYSLNTIVARLRYMGEQYAAGRYARGGGRQKHFLEEAADEIDRLRQELRVMNSHVLAKEIYNVGKAVYDVLEERSRQIHSERWTEEHDDQHDDRSLAAASCYLQHYIRRAWITQSLPDGMEIYQSDDIPDGWPKLWANVWWKPKSPRRDLVRAAALIIAEIERLDRVPK